MKKLGLVGKTLKHSFSKKYFSEKFEKESIKDYSYHLFELDSIDLFPKLIESDKDLVGLNVTIPYKEVVIPFLDKVNPDALEIGAVNTIAFENGKLVGYNTDIIGFRDSIKPFLTNKHERALILGTGGAAKAVESVLKKIGIQCVYVSRTPKEGQLTYDQITTDVLRFFKLIVNCSPVGTFPNVHEAPSIPYQCLDGEHLLYDLVYNPSETLFMKKGKEFGATVLNGYDMLVGQAEAAWRIWNKS